MHNQTSPSNSSRKLLHSTSTVIKRSISPISIHRSLFHRNNPLPITKTSNNLFSRGQASSFKKLQLDIINSIETTQTTDFIKNLNSLRRVPVQEYKTSIEKTMQNYAQLEAKTPEQFKLEENQKEYDETAQNPHEHLITAEDQSIIKKVYDLNHSLLSRGFSTGNINLTEESMLKINV